MVFLYPGAIHIHSIHSDGTGTIEEIVKAARKADLSWIIVTDHNDLIIKEGIYDGVCVIVGEEISPDYGDHYLAFNIKSPISPDMKPSEYIQKVREQGGFGFIAHPDEKKSRKNAFKSVSWEDWNIKGFDGLEIWNHLSNWADYYNDRSIFNTLNAYLFRNNVLTGPTERVLKWWDDLNSEEEKIVPAIGGIDAHAFKIERAFFYVKIFPYENSFKTINNFIHLENPMPEDFESRKKVILDAVKSGKNIIMNRAFGDKRTNPVFYAQDGNQKVYSGDSLNLDDNSKLVVELPLEAEIKVLHNGNVVLQKKTKGLELENLAKGKYRFEAYYKKRPWVFSNPILVK